MDNMQVIDLKDIHADLPKTIEFLRTMILSTKSYNFSPRILSKILPDNRQYSYVSLAPNINIPIDFLGVEQNGQLVQAYALCKEKCVEIPVSEYKKEYDRIDQFFSLAGHLVIPSIKANKISELYSDNVFSIETSSKIILLNYIVEKYYASSDCLISAEKYYDYFTDVIEYRQDIIGKISSNTKTEDALVIKPYHR